MSSTLQPLPLPRVTSEHVVVLRAFLLAAPRWSPPTQRWRDEPSASTRGHPERRDRLGHPAWEEQPLKHPNPEPPFQKPPEFSRRCRGFLPFKSMRFLPIELNLHISRACPHPDQHWAPLLQGWVNIQLINFHPAPSGPIWTSGAA